jgi:hypothetical protein
LLTVLSWFLFSGQYHLTLYVVLAHMLVFLFANRSILFLFLFSGQYHLTLYVVLAHMLMLIFAYRSILFFYIFRPVSPDPVCGAGTHPRVDICLPFHLCFFIFRPVSPDLDL